MAVDRRKLLAGVAAGLVLILAAWSLWPSPPQAQAPARTSGAARGKIAPAAESLGPMAPVKLGALNDARDAPGAAARNPFRFQPKVVAPPPPTRPLSQPVIEAPRVAPLPSGPPPVPPIPLKLIGVLERENGVKWAILSDGKSGPMYGKDGDIVDGRYVIVKIGTESVEITYTDGRGRQVIRLTGQ